MIAAMLAASHGDSVYYEDKTTNHFQERVAKLAGKEDAIFVVSGTMSNQVGIRCHLGGPPHSVLCDHRAHVVTAEAAGLAILSQAMVTAVQPSNGVYLTLDDVKQNVILDDDVHVAPTKVISLENTLGGSLLPIEEIEKISKFARDNGIKMHLDGARLWNASIATGISIAEYASHFDSVSLCFSKGLGAPVGSVLVGDKAFIKRAFWIRKQQGGGIRQAGLLTAAANVALDEVWPTMAETHEKAAALAKFLEELGVPAQIPVQTSFVFLDCQKAGIDVSTFIQEATKNGIKVLGPRIVLHHQISDEAIEKLKQSVVSALKISKEKISNGGAIEAEITKYGQSGKR